MASDLEHKAKEAFIDDHFELAVDLYTQAIGMSPNNAELFSDRAQANIKLQNYTGICLSPAFFFSFNFIICYHCKRDSKERMNTGRDCVVVVVGGFGVVVVLYVC